MAHSKVRRAPRRGPRLRTSKRYGLTTCGFIMSLLFAVSSGTNVLQTARGATPNGSPTPDARRHSRTHPTWVGAGSLPLSFVANVGQLDRRVKFAARTAGAVVYLTGGEIGLVLTGNFSPQVADAGPTRPREGEPSPARIAQDFGTLRQRRGPPAIVRMEFVGGNHHAAILAEDEMPGRVNYFLGNEPKKWRTNVPTFAKVRYKNVYPGIDLVFYGNGGKMEFDVVAQPGADLDRVAFSVRGAQEERIASNGDLVFLAGGNELRVRAPQAYQPDRRPRQMMAAHYVRKTAGVYGLECSGRDPTRSVVIDPVIVHSTYLGGTGYDAATSIALDPQGNVYVTGTTLSQDFPVVNPYHGSYAGLGCIDFCQDVFVSKFDATLKHLQYSTYLGGRTTDEGHAIAVSTTGEVLVVGVTASPDFPRTATFGAPGVKGAGFSAFVTKFDASGSHLVYSAVLQGTGDDDNARAVAIAADGAAWVVGETTSGDFPLRHAVQIPPVTGPPHAFVSVLDATGESLLFSTFLGGRSSDRATAVVLDSTGSAMVVGGTRSEDFPLARPVQQRIAGGEDAFLARFSKDYALTFSTYLGGSADDEARGVATDRSDAVWVVGGTKSSDFPTFNPLQRTLGGDSDAFVTKVDPTRPSILLSTFLGGLLYDLGVGVAVDQEGSAYVVGVTWSANFPSVDPFQPTNHGLSDLFVAKLHPTGTTLAWSSYVGGSGLEPQPLSYPTGAREMAPGIAVDSAGDVYVAASTSSADFPIVDGFQAQHAGFADAVIVKIHDDTPLSLGATATASPALGGVPLAVSFGSMVAGGTPPYTFDWDFADGSVHSTAQNPTHTFTTLGTYVVTVKVTDAVTASVQATVTITANEACTLACTASVPLAVAAGTSTTFTATATAQSYCGTPSFRWDFGDGQSSTEQNPAHAFVAPGLYTWTMTATVGSLTCQKGGTITVSQYAANQLLMIPALAHIPGTSGTLWRSDVAAVNRSNTTAHVALAYFSQASPVFRTATIPPMGTVEWRDLVTSLFEFAPTSQSSGSVHVVSDTNLVVTARTYNQTATGTLGQSYPALAPSEGLAAGTIGVIPQLKRNAGFRSNLGAINLGQSECTVMITLFSSDGAQLGHPLGITLAPGRWQQINDVLGKADAGDQELAYATIEVQTPSGRAWAYASVIDNSTGDPTTIPVIVP